MIADAHCDTLSKRLTGQTDLDVTADSLQLGQITLQTFAAFVNAARAGNHTGALYRAQVEDFARTAREYGLGIYSSGTPSAKKPMAVLSIEGGEALEGSLFRLYDLAQRDVKLFALTWNHENELGFPCGQSGGLKPFGKTAVRLMQRLGIGVDVSHLNEDGFWDVYDQCTTLLASHSCVKALCSHRRNLTDRQIRAIIEKRGFIGVNFYPPFLCEEKAAAAEDIVRHILHILSLGGEDAVGFGSDFDGIDQKTCGAAGPQDVPALLMLLEREGVPEQTIEKIAYHNFARFLSRL